MEKKKVRKENKSYSILSEMEKLEIWGGTPNDPYEANGFCRDNNHCSNNNSCSENTYCYYNQGCMNHTRCEFLVIGQ